MAGEDKVYWGGSSTLTTTGAALTSGSTVALAGSIDLAALSPADYPHLKFVLGITFATATGIEGKAVELISRELDIDGTSDEDTPTSTFRKTREVFTLKGVTSQQIIAGYVWNAPRKAEWYLFTECGQSASANWFLKAQAFSIGPV